MQAAAPRLSCCHSMLTPQPFPHRYCNQVAATACSPLSLCHTGTLYCNKVIATACSPLGLCRIGTLYCNEVTARLVRQQLRVAPERICTVPMCQPITVEGVRITFVDANHCPGAAMILFEPPGAPPVVHTGDCRQGGYLVSPASEPVAYRTGLPSVIKARALCRSCS